MIKKQWSDKPTKTRNPATVDSPTGRRGSDRWRPGRTEQASTTGDESPDEKTENCNEAFDMMLVLRDSNSPSFQCYGRKCVLFAHLCGRPLFAVELCLRVVGTQASFGGATLPNPHAVCWPALEDECFTSLWPQVTWPLNFLPWVQFALSTLAPVLNHSVVASN